MQEDDAKLYNRAANVAKEKVIDAIDTWDVDHNKAFIKGALRSALNGSIIFIMNNSSEI